MKARSVEWMIVGVLLAFGLAGCDHAPGKPGFRPETLRPSQTLDFATLYKQNCSACHGDDGLNAAAFPLRNPVYLSWAGRDALLQITAQGLPHSLMPAFAQSSGGMLTDQQVTNIVDGMISHWGKQDILNGANVPRYRQPPRGDAAAGKAAFEMHCARCHGADGEGLTGNGAKAANATTGSIVDPTYLSLISGQGLRDIVVSGLPGEGMPDWRGDGAGTPMTDKEVTDIVAWLAAQRVQFPGQPFRSSQTAGDKIRQHGK
ncbi:MAG: c-type cytochrome [Acidobacteriaceae bacterium]